MYEDIERRLMPMIRRKAARLRGFMDMDDAIQEARMVVFRVLHSYDFNRNPNLERYVGICLNNAFAGQYHKMSAQRRMPRRHTQDSEGNWATAPTPPMSLIEMDASDNTMDSEAGMMLLQSHGLVGRMIAAIWPQLNEKERAVIDAFIHPPPEIDVAPGEPGFNQAVAAYLGINKNALDWQLWRPRQLMLEAMRQSPEFDRSLVSGPEWPHLVHSTEWDDQDMILGAISDRQLDPIVCDTEMRTAGDAKMFARVYEWGEALCLRLGEASATLLLQGRFNRLSGTLHGRKYGSQQVPVPWYQPCMKLINGTSAKS
jgi:DNA-directed RNA polymerase specialized sigma24 family protein